MRRESGLAKSEPLPYLGVILLLVGVSILAMVLASVILGEAEYIRYFLIPGTAATTSGALLWLPRRNTHLPPLAIRDAMSVLVAGWILAFFVSAWPFSMAGLVSYRLALFESVSGWTTTGLSILNVEEVPRVFLLWRSTMQYLGGAGFAIAMLSSLIGSTGAGLSRAEGRQEVVPMVRQSAVTIGAIYLGYSTLGVFALAASGMPWFHALNHSMAALSTGGFSTVTDSIGHWPNPTLTAVTIVLMLAGNTNFLTHHQLLQFRWRRALRTPDIKTFLVTSVAAIAILMTAPGAGSLGAGEAIFQALSALTTTGFSTVDLTGWREGALMLIILLMMIGGGVNSTGGGIKQRRIYLILRSIGWHIREMALPSRAIVSHSFEDHGRVVDVDDEELRQVAGFVLLFIGTLLIATVAIALHGYPLSDSLFEAASALGTVGLSVGVTAADAPATVLWIEKICMFLGRLEFMAILVATARLISGIRTRPGRSFRRNDTPNP